MTKKEEVEDYKTAFVIIILQITYTKCTERRFVFCFQ